MPDPITTNPQGQTPNGTDPQGLTPTNTSTSGQTPNSQRTSIDTLPPDIQDYIKSLRADAKKYRDASEAEAKAKAEAEQARLKEQGEFKQLAEKHETRVKELEPVAQRYSTLAEQVRAKIKADIKDWPTEIMAFYPGDEAPVEQLNEWFNRSQPLLEKLQIQAKGQQPGNRPNPAPATQQTNRQQAMEANKASFGQKRSYGL